MGIVAGRVRTGLGVKVVIAGAGEDRPRLDRDHRGAGRTVSRCPRKRGGLRSWGRGARVVEVDRLRTPEIVPVTAAHREAAWAFVQNAQPGSAGCPGRRTASLLGTVAAPLSRWCGSVLSDGRGRRPRRLRPPSCTPGRYPTDRVPPTRSSRSTGTTPDGHREVATLDKSCGSRRRTQRATSRAPEPPQCMRPRSRASRYVPGRRGSAAVERAWASSTTNPNSGSRREVSIQR
jgi:hypothetical protein